MINFRKRQILNRGTDIFISTAEPQAAKSSLDCMLYVDEKKFLIIFFKQISIFVHLEIEISTQK
jgi:hypothetical protein